MIPLLIDILHSISNFEARQWSGMGNGTFDYTIFDDETQ